METETIISSPPSSIGSTVTSTFTDILQLSSISESSFCSSAESCSAPSSTSSSSSLSSSNSDHVETEEEVNSSNSSSCGKDEENRDYKGNHDNVFSECCSASGSVIGVLDEDGVLILVDSSSSNPIGTSSSSSDQLENEDKTNIDECKICYHELPVTRRSCCDYVTCADCLKQYFSSQVEMGSMRIECMNVQCHIPIDPEEIAYHLDTKLRDIYFRLIQENNCNLTSKTCPACSTMYTLESSQQLRTMKKMIKKDSINSRVKCPECKYYWCFLCHAPWHQGLTCGQYRQGDRLLKVWANQLSQGQLNAQRCPKCKTFIQKSGGCDHMHCNRCKTGFCYRCGEPLRRLKFFGDHYSKFSIFGCKYRYKKESPIQRKAIRGAVFASKLFLAPILGSLIFCAGTLFVSVAVAFLPFYGVVTIYKRYSS